MKVEEDVDMQGEEWEVNVKTEKNIAGEEEEGIYCEEKEEDDIDIKEEVSLEVTV